MGLEVATYVNQLNASNPVGGVDNYSTADDHLRLTKSTLLNSFPNIGGAVTATHTQLNYVTGVTSAIQTQLDARELLANKNANSGYAGLNASAQLADARVSASNVTQHQAALALAGSQITSGTVGVARLGSGTADNTRYLRGDGTWQQIAATEILSGTFANARVAAGNVTQHQAALSIATSQLTGTMPDARIAASNVTQHQASLALAASQITSGVFAAARITSIDITCSIGSEPVGFRRMPPISGWSNGECRQITGGVTLNTSDMSIGYIFGVYNDTNSSQTITAGGGVTMRRSGTLTTGSRTLLGRGLATIWCLSATEAIVSGDIT